MSVTWDTQTHRALTAETVKKIDLYDIYFDDAQEPLRWTSWGEDVVYDGNTYTPHSIKHSGISQGTDGKINPVVLTVGNADRVIQNYIKQYDLIGKRVRITELFDGAPDAIQSNLTISGAKAPSSSQVDFTLSIGVDALKVEVPGRRIFGNSCSRNFKQAGCNYTGPDATCDMVWADCVRKGNTINFGGFPGVINRRFYF